MSYEKDQEVEIVLERAMAEAMDGDASLAMQIATVVIDHQHKMIELMAERIESLEDDSIDPDDRAFLASLVKQLHPEMDELIGSLLGRTS